MLQFDYYIENYIQTFFLLSKKTKSKFSSYESHPKHSVKKQAKFEKVEKSTVQPSYIRQE